MTKQPEIPYDHPMIVAGFWPETMVFELWPYGVEYREKFLRRNGIPYRTIKGTRWFFRDDLLRWLRAGEAK